MDGRAESSRSRARNASGLSEDRYQHHRQRSASPDARMSRSSLSRSLSSDASVQSRAPSPPRTHRNDETSPSKTALRIDHLTSNVRSAHLHHICSWYGRVVRVDLTPSHPAKQRNGWAYVLMSTGEEAAKAALYLSGGQIDGASLTVSTCVPPSDLPLRSGGSRDWESRDRRADHEWQNGGRDRRGRTYGREARSVHPDRQRMLAGGDRYAARNSRDDEQRSRPMRKWSHPDSQRGRGSDLSPLPPPRRSSAGMRASPSY